MNISRKYNIITGDFANIDVDKSMVADFQDAQTVLMIGLGSDSGEAVLYAECLNEPLSVRERLNLPASRFIWTCAEAATANTDIRLHESGLDEQFKKAAEANPEKFFEENGQLLQNRLTLAQNVCETVRNLAKKTKSEKQVKRGK
jgi:hypothetical protein